MADTPLKQNMWYNYGIGHGYITDYLGPGTDSPHYAFDLDTPEHTAFTAPLSGTVKVADYAYWNGVPGGGEVFVQPDNTQYPEWYVYHLDELDVQPGQHVQAGQLVGLTGGGNYGYPGAKHPVDPMWSSGPHLHIGWHEKYIQTPQGSRDYGHNPSDLLSIAKGTGGVTTLQSPFSTGSSSPIPGVTISKDFWKQLVIGTAGIAFFIMGGAILVNSLKGNAINMVGKNLFK